MATNKIATPTNVTGSVAPTPNNKLDTTRVTNNLFASSTRLGFGVAAYLEALDGAGTVLSKQKLPR